MAAMSYKRPASGWEMVVDFGRRLDEKSRDATVSG